MILRRNWSSATTLSIWAIPAWLALYQFAFGAVISEDFGDLVLFRTVKTWIGILHGDLPFWDSQIGLGAPFSNTQDLGFHPLGLLLLVMPLQPWIAAFAFVHLVIGLYFVRRISRVVGASPMATFVAVVTYGLSMPSVEYAVFSAYPSILIGWALLPVLMYLGLTAWEQPDLYRRVRGLLLFALAGAFVFLNSHVGMSFGGLVASGCLLALVALEGPSRWRRLMATAAIGLVIALLSADKVTSLFTELRHFPDDTLRSGKFFIRAFYPDAIWHLLFRPFFLPDLVAIRQAFDHGGLIGAAGEALQQGVLRNAEIFVSRQWLSPFFGPAFFVLAIFGALSPKVTFPHKRAVGLTFLLCLLILPLPPRLYGLIGSGTVAFKDPLVLTGIVMGAAVLTYLERLARGRTWKLPREIAAAQIGLLALGIIPTFYVTAFQSQYISQYVLGGLPYVVPVERWTLDSRTVEQISRVVTPGERLYDLGSPAQPFQLLQAGFTVVGGAYFKGVSMESLYRSPALMYAYIPADRDLISSPMKDVLGIRYVLAPLEAEPPGDLRPVGRFTLGDGRSGAIYRNDRAWPLAVSVSDAILTATLPRRSGCGNDGLLCHDLAGVSEFRAAGDPSIERRNGDIVLRFQSMSSARTIMVSEMHRPGWTAESRDARLPIRPLLGALIGVSVPAGTEEIVLSYRPPERVVARSAAAITLTLVALGLVLTAMKRPSWPPRSV